MSRQSRSVASSGASISYSFSARLPLEESYRQIFRATCTRSASQSRDRCGRAVERVGGLRDLDAHGFAELREIGGDRGGRATRLRDASQAAHVAILADPQVEPAAA